MSLPYFSGDSSIAIMNIQGEVKSLVEGQTNHQTDRKPEADLVPRTLVISSDGQLLVMTQGGYALYIVYIFVHVLLNIAPKEY